MTPSKVLIVDDAVDNLRVLGTLLEEAGYDLRVATGGEQALEMAQNEHPDLILLDVLMPGGVDGHEVCRRLKANTATAEIPVVFMTAYNDEADEAAGLELGAVDFVMKPFRLPVVLRRVASHLAYSRMQNALKEQAAGLEQLVALRTEELNKANERLTKLDATKALYLRLLAHELRAPAAGLVGIGELALQGVEDQEKRERLRSLFRVQKERLDFLFEQYERLVNWQTEDGGSSHRKIPPVRLDELLNRAWEKLAAMGVTVPTAPEGSLFVQSEPRLLLSVLEGLARWLAAVAENGSLSARYEDGDQVCISWTVPGDWEGRTETTLTELAEDDLSGPAEVRGWLPLIDVTVDALGGDVSVLPGKGWLEVTLRLPAYRGR